MGWGGGSGGGEEWIFLRWIFFLVLVGYLGIGGGEWWRVGRSGEWCVVGGVMELEDMSYACWKVLCLLESVGKEYFLEIG